MNKPAIEIEVKDVYGQPKYYPVNNAAKVFARIAGTKTLTVETINSAKELGFVVNATYHLPKELS